MNITEWTLVKKLLGLVGAPVKPADHNRVSKHLNGRVSAGTLPQQRQGRPKSKAGRYKR